MCVGSKQRDAIFQYLLGPSLVGHTRHTKVWLPASGVRKQFSDPNTRMFQKRNEANIFACQRPYKAQSKANAGSLASLLVGSIRMHGFVRPTAAVRGDG